MAKKPVETKVELTEKAVLVGLVSRFQTEEMLLEYLDELEFLASTAGAVTVEKFYQKLNKPDIRFYVGKGKLEEIRDYVKANEVDVVIFDDEISPAQLRNIEKEMGCKVLDRSMLILDIFAQRAQTDQAKTQVELAQTQYMLPRLKGMWSHLDRQKGGIGQRGAGEKEIETDKRIAMKNISFLKEKLKKIDSQNTLRRKNRGEYIRVALVGYTNVGKSTLMNVLAKAEVLAENKLFATLDTTVRKVAIDDTPFLISDTVGFIRKLPHHLVESFKSTLDEAVEADILIHVVDVSHPGFEDQINTVIETLKSLDADQKPTITVFNKIDNYRKQHFDPFLPEKTKSEILNDLKQSWMSRTNSHVVFISATEKENIAEFRELLKEKIIELYQIRYPYKTTFYTAKTL